MQKEEALRKMEENYPPIKRRKKRATTVEIGSDRVKDLRVLCLKKQCLLHIIEILTILPISLLTRDAVIEIPTVLLREMIDMLPLDLADRRTQLLFLAQEIIFQRTISNDYNSLNKDACVSCIRLCGTLPCDKISHLFRNFHNLC